MDEATYLWPLGRFSSRPKLQPRKLLPRSTDGSRLGLIGQEAIIGKVAD